MGPCCDPHHPGYNGIHPMTAPNGYYPTTRRTPPKSYMKPVLGRGCLTPEETLAKIADSA